MPDRGMRLQLPHLLTALAVALAVAAPPWLALHEARREAYGMEAALALNYARDVLHRSDQAFGQAFSAIRRVSKAPGTPCSVPTLALMRDIDLTSSYIQAIGHVRDGTMECSSVGGPPVPLGSVAFQTRHGYTLYDNVPLVPGSPSPLLGVTRDGVVVLVHHDLPLDIWTAVPGVSLAVVHLEQHFQFLARGHVAPAWGERLGNGAETSFVDHGWLVGIVRSPNYPTTAAVAAVPATYLEERIEASTRRLVPAGLFGGLAAAAAILLLARQQMSMVAALRAGLRRGEFFLLYQPVVDLKTGAWVGAEALLRWRRSAGDLVGPDLFIPIAEQSGLITRLTEQVLDLVEADAGAFLAAHPEFHVGVNLSPADFRLPAMAERIAAMLERCGARGSNLIVEITERGFLDLDSARTIIGALRTRGIEIAIDDFGTGYSSLSYLETLDLDYLKIDRSFIEAIGTDAPTSQVVGHIIAMARTLDLAMIAEGIESPAQLEFLRGHGVQLGQGWLFGKPMPFADLARSVQAQGAHVGVASPG